jgi:hypothetical protein
LSSYQLLLLFRLSLPPFLFLQQKRTLNDLFSNLNEKKRTAPKDRGTTVFSINMPESTTRQISQQMSKHSRQVRFLSVLLNSYL